MKASALLGFALPVMLSASAQALGNQTTHCQRGDDVRVIEVVYPQGTELPCEVHYRKNGNDSVLWRANNAAGYCEQKAAEFAEKQRSWGWQCVAMAAAKPVTTPDAPTQ
jgi:hypothetical protein